jgi:16S rRNA (guanine966-N2)-methyltransferase
MRIVGGRLKGKGLAPPRGASVRPTSDRLRESLFDILAHVYEEPGERTRVLDAFAGTGALGLEALSRGASFALFIDSNVESLSLVRGNLDRLNLTAESEVMRADATKLGRLRNPPAFDLAFLDPPYGKGLASAALASLGAGDWLTRNALAIVEDDRLAEIASAPRFETIESRVYGGSRLSFLRFRGAPDS